MSVLPPYRRREAILEKDQKLRTFVCDRLAEGWTPEQISGWLKAGNERRLRAVGCETIYAFIYRAYQKAEQLWRYLTRRHKRRRPRRSRPSRDTIKDRVSIHERPKAIDARTEAGHWEGDLIICKRTRPVLVLHERKSRVTLAARLIGKTAAETISVMLAVFDRIAPTLRKSISASARTPKRQAPPWILERGATVYEKRICTSLPSSLRIAWNGVLKPRHFLGVRLVVRTMSWISSSDTLSMSV